MRLFKTDLDFDNNNEVGLNPAYAVEKMFSNYNTSMADRIKIVVRPNNDLSNIEFYGEPIGNEDLTQDQVDEELVKFDEYINCCDEQEAIKLLND